MKSTSALVALGMLTVSACAAGVEPPCEECGTAVGSIDALPALSQTDATELNSVILNGESDPDVTGYTFDWNDDMVSLNDSDDIAIAMATLIQDDEGDDYIYGGRAGAGRITTLLRVDVSVDEDDPEHSEQELDRLAQVADLDELARCHIQRLSRINEDDTVDIVYAMIFHNGKALGFHSHAALEELPEEE